MAAITFQMNYVQEIWSSSFGDSTRQILPRENSHTKHMGVGTYGKIHCKRGTTYHIRSIRRRSRLVAALE